MSAPPQRAASQRTLCARTRSSRGSHVVNALVMFGKQPASPAPNRKRTTIMLNAEVTHPVAAVKNDHHRTTRSSTFFGPNRSPSHPPGISNSAYARVKAPNT